jgi:hypothetical protein
MTEIIRRKSQSRLQMRLNLFPAFIALQPKPSLLGCRPYGSQRAFVSSFAPAVNRRDGKQLNQERLNHLGRSFFYFPARLITAIMKVPGFGRGRP